jgi:hypothetical protein
MKSNLHSIILVALTLAGLAEARAQVGPGSALQFDGGASQVQIPAPALQSLSNQLTFEAWINPQTAACQTILSSGTGLDPSTDTIFDIGWNGSSCGAQMSLVVCISGWYYGVAQVPLNNWVHVAVTADGTNVSFYINGIPDSTTPQTTSITQTGLPLFLGRQGSSCDCNFLQGGMDEVRIWSVALTQAQISSTMNHALTGNEPGLVAYYRFDEGSGANAHNSAAPGSIYDGSLVNNPVWTNSGAQFVPDVVTGAASNITGVSATLSAAVNPGNLPTTAYIRWGTSTGYGNYGATNSLPAVNGSSNLLLAVSGLTLSTTYHYQIVATNSGGIMLGNDQTFTTLDTNGGTWTSTPMDAPSGVLNDGLDLALLLSDGSVLLHDANYLNNWYRLTPGLDGHYADGTWSNVSPMHCPRQFFASDVLRDGRVFVAGGEDGLGTTNAEIYDPVADSWSDVIIPPGIIWWTNLPVTDPNGMANAGFVDSGSVLLSDGRVLIAPVIPATGGTTAIYDPVANTWSTEQLVRGWNEDEASWVKLRDNSILVVDFWTTNSERFIPSLDQWINDGNVPVALFDPVHIEIGPPILLPNGQAFFIGGNHDTAIYTPTGSTNPGVWTRGPNIPDNLNAQDAPAAMMPNGKILCDFSAGLAGNPTYFYEYDYLSGSFSQVNAPGGGVSIDDNSDFTVMLDLPDGSVLLTAALLVDPTDTFFLPPFIYQPVGPPLAAGKPAILSITLNADGSYHLTGTQFNGISQGASFGDDKQMDSNFPLVRFTDSSGNVRYGRSYNWSTAAVMTGTNIVSTECQPPAGSSPQDLIQVVANGIASDAVMLGPVVTTNSDSGPGSLRQAIASSTSGSTIIFASNLSGQTIALTSGELLLSNSLTIDASSLASPVQINGNHNSRIFEVAGANVVTLNSLTLSNGYPGSAASGGAILNSGTLSVSNCTLTGNSVDSSSVGGAIVNYGPLLLSGCTLSGNSADFAGAINNNSSCTLQNCTFYGNLASGGNGGAIDNASASLSVLQCTFVGNNALGAGGAIDNFLSQTYVTNSIVAGNNCNGSGLDIYNWSSSTVSLGGSNVIESLDNAGGTVIGAASMISASPLVAPLGNYGGSTRTMPPLPGSPAADAAISMGVTVDQRGVPRPLGVAPDIGAFEGIYNPAGPGRLTGARLGNGSFRFGFTNFTDASFTVVSSTNLALSLSLWPILGPAVESPLGSGQFQFTDPLATNSSKRFYRVRWP